MANFLYYAGVIALGIFSADVLNFGLKWFLMRLAVRRIRKQLAQMPMLPMLPMRYPDAGFGPDDDSGSGIIH